MEIKNFFIVEATHPNMGIIKDQKVFDNKKEAMKYAKRLAEGTFYEILVVSKDGVIASANYDDLSEMGKLFLESER